MKIILDDIDISLEKEGNGVRARCNEDNIILPQQDIQNVADLISNNYKLIYAYYLNSVDNEINNQDIKIVSIKIAFHYLYMYNMWRNTYQNEKNRNLKFEKKDLTHPSTYDIIFFHFKHKYSDDWIKKCASMMNISVNECKE